MNEQMNNQTIGILETASSWNRQWGTGIVTKWVLDGVSESTRASVSLETHTLRMQVPLRTTFQPAMTHEARDVSADGIQGLRVN